MHRQEDSTIRRVLRGVVPVAVVLCLFAYSAAPASAQTWRTSFSEPTRIQAAGEHDIADGRKINFESFSPLELEPSVTAYYTIEGNQVVFEDSKPALRRNPNAPPTYVRAEGTISAITWVDEEFSDVKMTGEFNTAKHDAFSRQGLLARWDQGNNHYWFYVNFSTGRYGIVRSRFFGVLMIDLPNSSGPIENFKNDKTYYLEFELEGAIARGRVYEQTERGRELVGDTGDVVDDEPFYKGVSGTLIELWEETPYRPLQGSFANVTTTALR